MPGGYRLDGSSPIAFRMRTHKEMIDLLMTRVRTKGITTRQEWNAFLNDPNEFDEGERRIIKWLLAVEDVSPV